MIEETIWIIVQMKKLKSQFKREGVAYLKNVYPENLFKEIQKDLKKYNKYLKYYDVIKRFKNLKLALIDYDILCPKTLILALEKNNIKIIAPQTDILACGEFGVGKMAEPQVVFERIENFFRNQNLLKGKNILITAGATYEPIDSVRFIGNRSSGIQAIKIAEILTEMGANITFVSANIKQEIPLKKEQIIEVGTADEMFLAVRNNIKNIDCFIGCSAVSDYKVKNPNKGKIKKDKSKNGGDSLIIELVENPDILEFVGNLAKDRRPKLVIGFGAESEDLEKYGKEKLIRKKVLPACYQSLSCVALSFDFFFLKSFNNSFSF